MRQFELVKNGQPMGEGTPMRFVIEVYQVLPGDVLFTLDLYFSKKKTKTIINKNHVPN